MTAAEEILRLADAYASDKQTLGRTSRGFVYEESREALAAAVRELERERDEVRANHNSCILNWEDALSQRDKAEREVKRLRELLRDCSEKLLLYYKAHPEYVGGQEHSQLQKRIADALGESR